MIMAGRVAQVGAAAHAAGEIVSGAAVPWPPRLGLIEVNRAGQVPHGLAGGVTEPCPAGHVDHFLPAEWHRDHRISLSSLGMPGFSGYPAGVTLDSALMMRSAASPPRVSVRFPSNFMAKRILARRFSPCLTANCMSAGELPMRCKKARPSA